MTPFEKAFETVSKLAQEFKENLEYYKRSTYQEAEVRKDFIDPFFIALGWDVNHDFQKNPYKQEVKVEKSQKQVGAAGKKFADYAFYLDPDYKNPKFFVEAKKPSVAVENNSDYYLQTHKYGWNAQTPLAVLTDFEEFVILDCRSKPHPKYSSQNGVKVFSFLDYLDNEKFAEIYWLFSREAVEDNSLEGFVETYLKTRKTKARQGKLFGGGYKAVDNDFLEYIDELRLTLAIEFHKSNPSISAKELTEATQKTIDRLVFIRFLEDKQIEATDHIYNLTEWSHFVKLSKALDAKYNGVVFKPSLIDQEDFKGMNKTAFKDVCLDISSKESPYNFNSIPIHILGSIYERFLGKIVVIKNNKVGIEYKESVRKAGGVFYTPKYVVDHIIDNSIKKQIDGKTPKEINNMSFADIACGSGSFLINVYEYLIDYHKEYYQTKLGEKEDIDGRSEDFSNVRKLDGSWVITLKRKQEILLNNIYGLDIDNQAVEVTQLSLFLKLLEDESLSSTSKQTTMFSKVLPDLTKNIVCGNSLIDWDYENIDELKEVPFTEINPLNVIDTFPEVFKRGGFNTIIGNPPWVDIKGLDPKHVKYFFNKYDTTSNRMNIYATFIHKAIDIIKEDGMLAYIIPSSLLFNSSYRKLREKILAETDPFHIVRTPDKVFEGVTCETVIVNTKKTKTKKDNCECIVYSGSQVIDKIDETEAIIVKTDKPSRWDESNEKVFDIYTNNEIRKLLEQVESHSKKFNDYFEFCLGLTPYDKYKGHTQEQIKNKVFHADKQKDDTFLPLLSGGSITRYNVHWEGNSFISYGPWLGAPREKKFFTKKRVLVRQIASGKPPKIFAAFTDKEYYNPQAVFNIIQREESKTKPSIELICAILNSDMMNTYHTYRFLDVTKTTFQKVLIKNVKEFPLPDLSKKENKNIEKEIIRLIEKLRIHKEASDKLKIDSEKAMFQRKEEFILKEIENQILILYSIK